MKWEQTWWLVALLATPAILGSAAQAATARTAGVSYFSAAQVATAFSTGAPLAETDQYRVIASRRDKAGEAELHVRETDVFYVVSGRAEFVTGGTLVSPRALSADEQRAVSIVGGVEQTLSPGDVVVVPVNTPHWFKLVSGPFLYFTVKPITPAERH